ncbi:hypothetical protein SAMN04488087_2669 [Rhodothermus profundi]|uniref:Uncharacterized protein n=1 Tax=Rhodothermus profundi TaxID=633813 RepID=A0A1M6XQH8_9BACT|nr:hypothetical protein SAMN04488087_2669 [Rhodothermus profundi]
MNNEDLVCRDIYNDVNAFLQIFLRNFIIFSTQKCVLVSEKAVSVGVQSALRRRVRRLEANARVCGQASMCPLVLKVGRPS